MSSLPGESKTPITSSKHKSVFLHQWWLTKVERASRIGVGGFANKESLGALGMRLLGSPSTDKNINTIEDEIKVFNSAAIAKRHDSNTLEAVDGIIITISGCINKSRSLSYGFSPEVCDGFLSGFPYTWEDYATKSSHEKHANTTKQSLPVTFNDLPVTRVRDLLISESGLRGLKSIVLRDALKHAEKIVDQSVSSTNKICKSSIETEVDHNQDDDVSLSNLSKKMIEEDEKIDLQFENSKKTEVDHNQDVSLSNPTQKMTEKDKIDLRSGNSKEIEGGDKSVIMHKITRKKQLKESPRRYLLRSAQKRKRI